LIDIFDLRRNLAESTLRDVETWEWFLGGSWVYQLISSFLKRKSKPNAKVVVSTKALGGKGEGPCQ
jgi:hypothetical protein